MKLGSKACFLLASKINSGDRLMFARRSLESLGRAMRSPYRLIVVHDSRRKPPFVPRAIFNYLPSEKADAAGLKLYKAEGASVLRRFGKGSASALQIAVGHAMREGFEFGYIHMDDHIYCAGLPQLLEHAVEELKSSPNLAWLRFSGYPIISSRGQEFVRFGDTVCFDSVTLERHVRNGYTCWSSSISERSTQGRYWPVAMWHTLYRMDILRALLGKALEGDDGLHLAHVEEFYKNHENIRLLADKFGPMRFGYINMQFAGFEMHRNENYRELLAMPNSPFI